jgi:hypothetical protein
MSRWNPRASHLLLGRIALYLEKKEVFCEARTFLEFLQRPVLPRAY